MFNKAITKYNTEKKLHVTGIHPVNENTLCENESLSSYVTERTYSRVTEPAKSPSSSTDSDEEGKSAGFMKVSPAIIRPLPKDGPRKTGGRKHG